MNIRTFLVLLLVVGATTAAVAATWKEGVWTDRLTGQKHIYMVVNGRGSIRQIGHSVTAQLELICTHPDDGSPDYLSARVSFSETVAIGEARVRYRFDNGPVESQKFGFSTRGDSFTLVSKYESVALTELRNSSKLRMEVSLPWARDPLIEFDTAGAGDAIDRVPCGPR